jgi:hypothetical protein
VQGVFQDNELFNAVLAFAVLVFILTQIRDLKRLPKWTLLFSAYGILVAGLVATILEGVFWPSILNVAEHACYAFSALFFSLWCWRALPPGRRS